MAGVTSALDTSRRPIKVGEAKPGPGINKSRVTVGGCDPDEIGTILHQGSQPIGLRKFSSDFMSHSIGLAVAGLLREPILWIKPTAAESRPSL
jgi:hypothetical protein